MYKSIFKMAGRYSLKKTKTNKQQQKNKRTKQQIYPYIISKLLQDAYRLICFQDICLLKLKKQFRMKRKKIMSQVL